MPLRTVTPNPRRTFQPFPGADGGSARDESHRLLLAKALDGKLNCTAEVTLEVAPATTTVLSDPRILATSTVLFSPTTANAAAALATTYAVAAQGSVTFNHGASAQTDRTFRVAVLA